MLHKMKFEVSTSSINKWLMHVYATKFHDIFLTDSKLLPQLKTNLFIITS